VLAKLERRHEAVVQRAELVSLVHEMRCEHQRGT
jgi:hypothetical protein